MIPSCQIWPNLHLLIFQVKRAKCDSCQSDTSALPLPCHACIRHPRSCSVFSCLWLSVAFAYGLWLHKKEQFSVAFLASQTHSAISDYLCTLFGFLLKKKCTLFSLLVRGLEWWLSIFVLLLNINEIKGVRFD